MVTGYLNIDGTHFIQGNSVPVTVYPSSPAPEPYLPCQQCEAIAGQPINLTNGNVWIEQHDYSIPGLGGGLSLSRTWNSLWRSNDSSLPNAGMFGDSWRSTYEEGLYALDSNNVKYVRSNGDHWYFLWNNSTNNYQVDYPANQHATLTFDPVTSQGTIAFAGGTKKIFDGSSRLLTTIIDRNGNVTTITYDSSTRISKVTDAASRSLTFSYADPNNTRQATSVADATGTVATYVYGSSSALTKVTYADASFDTFNYDGGGQLLITSVTDSQGKVLETHTYDSSRRGLTSARANGVESVTVAYNNPQVQLTDSFSNATTYGIGNGGALKFVTSVSGTTCSSCGAQTSLSENFDTSGNLLSRTDALGNVTNYTYDGSGNLLTKATPLANGTTPTWTYTYNAFGEVLTATDPLNHVTTNVYDANGNLLTTTTPSPDGVLPGSTTTFAYNTNGTLATIKDPLNNLTTIGYFTTGLINTIKDAANNTTTYAYDARGNRTSIIDPVNGSQKPTTFAYDSMNRLTKITYPDSTFVQFGYDSRGRRTSVTDQNAKITAYAYDDADRLISVTDAQTPTHGVTQYAYDTENNLTSITDALNRQTLFHYDAERRLDHTTFPSTLIESYGYDAANNLTSKTDRNNQTIIYNYDALGRLTSKSYPDGSGVSYTYDLAGRMTEVQDGTGTYGFTYDNMGRLTQTTTDYAFDAAGAYSMEYGYDAASNRLSMTDPQSQATSYVYDVLNRLKTLSSPQGSFCFSYDALSRRTQMTRPNGITTNYSYNPVSTLASVLHQSGKTTFDGATYTYDAAGNRLTKVDKRTGTQSNYTYDAIYQLTKTTQGTHSPTTTETYNYDLVGNRLSSLGVSPYSYNSSNELTSIPSLAYTYDSNGNTKTKSDGTQYTWDFENRLTQVVMPGTGGTVTFKYDPFGRRIQKAFTKNSTTTTTDYLYDGPNLVEEVDNAGNVLARYTQGKNLDEPLAELRTGNTSYYEADGLGSITSLSNGAGALANTYTYNSFGNLSASTGTVSNPFRYTEREFDSETGIYEYRSRYYDSVAGRFISEDPISFGGGNNFYRYVGNNATNLIDRFGLSAKTACVNTHELAKCIWDQFALVLLNFSPTVGEGSNGNNANGWATIMYSWFPISSFTVTNDISKGWESAPRYSQIYQDHNLPMADGWTSSKDPYTNYTENGAVGQTAVDTQIWELGNSLAWITHTMPTSLPNWTKDPGGVLLKCYLKAVGREKDIDWE
jgi:RHS repeat-associated protein